MILREDIKELFDIQIKRMLTVIDEQYEITNKNDPRAQIVRRPRASMQRSSTNRVSGLFGSFWWSRQFSLCQTMPQGTL